MDQNLGLTLTDEDYEVLSIKYGNNKGLINYPLFIETMQIRKFQFIENVRY